MSFQKTDSIPTAKMSSQKRSEAKDHPSFGKVAATGRSADVDSLVRDYLVKKNLVQTLSAFEREVQVQSRKEGLSAKILQHFDAGDAQEFFSAYQTLQKSLPTQTPTMELDRTEFYYHVYFVVFDVHPGLGRGREPSAGAVNRLKNYLEEKGGELAKFPELVPYFAIPFIKNLKEHSSFKHLFAPSWPQQIREGLKAAVGSAQGSYSDLEIALNSVKSLTSLPANDPKPDFSSKTRELNEKSEELEHWKDKYHRLDEESKETIHEIHKKWSTFVR